MALSRAKIAKEKKRIAVAQHIDATRKGLASGKDRVPTKSDTNELIQYVMAQIRTSPLKLIDLKPDKAKPAGPFTAIALKLVLEGNYAEVDDLLQYRHSAALAVAFASHDFTTGSTSLAKSFSPRSETS